MRTVLVTAPTFKPMEVDLIMLRPEIRGLVGSDDKLLVADFLESAIEAFQEFTNNILCRSTWDLYLDEFPEGQIETPAPLVSVTSIAYLDSAGSSQTLADTAYKVDTTTGQLTGRITLKYGQVWPAIYDEADAVTVRLVAGYANANAVPSRIKDGLVAYIQEMFSGVDMSGVYHDKWRNYRRIPC